MNKFLLSLTALGLISLAATSCRQPNKADEPQCEHPASAEHPEHPKGEHPEHPKGEHPKCEHPK